MMKNGSFYKKKDQSKCVGPASLCDTFFHDRLQWQGSLLLLSRCQCHALPLSSFQILEPSKILYKSFGFWYFALTTESGGKYCYNNYNNNLYCLNVYAVPSSLYSLFPWWMLAGKAWIVMPIYPGLNSWVVAVPRFGLLYFCPKHMVFSLYFMVHLGMCHAVEVMYLEFPVNRSRLRGSSTRWLAWAAGSKGRWNNNSTSIGDKEQLIQWAHILLTPPPVEETLESKGRKEKHFLLEWTYTHWAISKCIYALYEE